MLRGLGFIFLVLLFSTYTLAQDAGSEIRTGKNLIKEGKSEEAKTLFEKEIKNGTFKAKEDKAEAFLWYGVALLKIGELADSEEALQKSSKYRKKAHADTLYYQGIVEIAKGEKEAALAYFNRSIAADETHGASWFELGELLLADKRVERARIAFEMAIKHKCDKSETARARIESIDEGKQMTEGVR
ncbi:MAG: tetratricopeptide repeat protein [Pyrinomonadaceae bacterium]